MFISQVTFEMNKENEEMLRNIMQKKLDGAKNAVGNIGGECWRKEEGENVGYSLVLRWENKEAFQTWMKEDHKPENRGARPEGERPKMAKSGAQYEVVEF